MQTKDAIAVFGSRRKMADALGISTQATYQWGETVPKLRAYEILDLERDRLKSLESCDE